MRTLARVARLSAWSLALVWVSCGDDDRPAVVDAGDREAAVPADAPIMTIDMDGMVDPGGPWTAFCAMRETSCGATDGADCRRYGACYEEWVRAEWVTAYIDCLETMGCAARDDDCAYEAYTSITVTPEGEAYATQCSTRLTECAGVWDGGDGGGACDSRVGSSVVDSVRVAYEACLAQPCDMISACYTAAEPSSC